MRSGLFVVLVAVACLVAGCGQHGASSAGPRAPTLDCGAALALAIQADEARSGALAGEGAAALAAVFRGAALARLEDQARAMATRGIRLEETQVVRVLEACSPSIPDVVLQVEAEQRLVTPDASAPAWSATERHVWIRFQYLADSWSAVEIRDVAPASQSGMP